MKKTILLSMLLWLAFSAANITAQVRIGGASDPASSAILDLNPGEEAVATGGLLLPRVSLASLRDNVVFGNKTPIAQGIMVYNLNDGDNSRPREGIYCYDGRKWLFVGIPGDCQPEPITEIQFTGLRDGGENILLNDEFEATAFPVGDESSIYYRWLIPRDYFDLTGQGKRTIKLRNKGITGVITDEIKVRAESRCGTTDYYANTTPLYTSSCSRAPADPTYIAFSMTTIRDGETFTATAVGATTAKKYNWTIPGEYFDIIGDNTQQKIQLKVRKVATSPFTGEIRVSAENDCGKSDEYINTTPINVLVCLGAPFTPAGITFGKKILQLNETITLTANIPSGSPAAKKYNWTIPGEYFDIIGDGTQQEIQLKAKMATTTPLTGEIRVNAENDCGKSDDFSNLSGIDILSCSDVPPVPVNISFSKTVMQVGETFTATAVLPADIVQSTTPTAYKWLFSNWYFRIEGSNSSQTITLKAIGSTNSDNVVVGVVAQNSCGSSDNYNSSTKLTVTCASPPANEDRHHVACTAGTIAPGQTITFTAPFHENATYDWSAFVKSYWNLDISGNGNTATATVARRQAIGKKYTLYAGTPIVNITDACGQTWEYELAHDLTVYGY